MKYQRIKRMKNKNNMKLLMENFNKFLEEEKIDEMNFNPMVMAQMNPALSMPDYVQDAFRAIIMEYSPNPDDPRLKYTDKLAYAKAPHLYAKDNPDNPNAKQEMQDMIDDYMERAKSASPEELENMLQSLPDNEAERKQKLDDTGKKSAEFYKANPDRFRATRGQNEQKRIKSINQANSKRMHQ